MDTIGIGLVGCGSIGRIHTLSYKDLPMLYPGVLPPLALAAVCTSRPETAAAAAREGGYASWFTDVKELVSQDSVSVVDCFTPNHQHRRSLLAAIAAGKHVYCEKPLALNGAEAREVVGEAEKAVVSVGMAFAYRFVPALMRAKQMIADGLLGEVYSFRAEYFHTGYQDPQRPLGWRMRQGAVRRRRFDGHGFAPDRPHSAPAGRRGRSAGRDENLHSAQARRARVHKTRGRDGG